MPVPNFEHRYEVSSLGNIRGAATKRDVKKSLRTSGHLYVTLRGIEGSRRTIGVHRLVCEAFNGPPTKEKPWALHWDDNPSNNLPENLRWGTPSDNVQDCIRNGHHGSLNKTHCVRGHALSVENVRRSVDGTKRICLECETINRRRNRAKASSQELSPDDPRHGRPIAYGDYKCRCDKCTSASRAKSQEGVQSRTERGLPLEDKRHGTQTGYKQWGCRCDLCRRSNADYESNRKRSKELSS